MKHNEGFAPLRKLAPLVLPLLLTRCAKPDAEVMDDIHAAVQEVYDRELANQEPMECQAANLLIGGVLHGRGYERDEDKYVAKGAVVNTYISDNSISVTGNTEEGDLIMMKMAACKND